MAWGGGKFITQNKTIGGAYINVVSASRASITLSDRGTAAMPLTLDWGVDGKVFTVTNEDFILRSKVIFGYEYTHEKLKGLRDLFLRCRVLHVYRLNGGVKASNEFATAKYSGTRGNDLKTVIAQNVDSETMFDVYTYLGFEQVDVQTVQTASELVSNEFCDFNTEAELVETASTPFTNGSNADSVTGSQWQSALGALENYSFNIFGAVTTDASVKSLVEAWVKRMRDELGIKFQVVAYKLDSDDKAVISVENGIEGETVETGNLVYWVTGAESACKINESLTNTKYDGEFAIDLNHTQKDLEDGIKAGKFMFHRVGDDAVVLSDINTKVTITETENEVFQSNQTVRVVDQSANDIALLWNTKYLGKVLNNHAGRISFWNEMVKYFQELERLGAIEGFLPEHVTVMAGEGKKDVVVNANITVVNCMERLYMTITVA